MGLAKVLADVELAVKAVCGEAGEKIPSFAFGDTEKFREEAPPRVVWVPLAGRRDERATTRGIPTQRTLFGRTLTVQARIWAATFESGEALAAHLVAALHKRAHGSFEYMSEEFAHPDDLDLGFRDLLTFALQIPMRDEPLRTVKPTAAGVTGEFDQQEVQP